MPHISNRLIGKAGVGLACFHLGRMGREFTLTNDNSGHGDIWADFGDGPKIVEVKSTTRPVWAITRSQWARVNWYVFVNVIDADCWLLPASSFTARFSATDSGSIMVLGREMGDFGATPLHRSTPNLYVPVVKPYRSGGVRRVKKKLASGEIKIYEYPC
jgi:hypothetical protein